MKALSVLVVEDDEAMRTLVAGLLAKQAHRVVAVGDGLAAIRCLTHDRFDVVLTDILMPDGDGLEVIMATKRLQPCAALLAISGGSTQLDANFCLRLAGGLAPMAVLPKPFTPRELIEAVQAAYHVSLDGQMTA